MNCTVMPYIDSHIMFGYSGLRSCCELVKPHVRPQRVSELSIHSPPHDYAEGNQRAAGGCLETYCCVTAGCQVAVSAWLATSHRSHHRPPPAPETR